MKDFLKFNKLFASAIALIFTLGFVSCSDDDDDKVKNPEVTKEVVYGDFTGKMITKTNFDSTEEQPGKDVSAKVDKDTIYIAKLPIDDIVLGVAGEELAPAIIQALGDVSYAIGYEPAVAAEFDFVHLNLKPEPLMLSLTLPTEEGSEEATTFNIKVSIKAETKGDYEVKTKGLAFSFTAESVTMLQGETEVPVDTFKPVTFNFTLKK